MSLNVLFLVELIHLTLLQNIQTNSLCVTAKFSWNFLSSNDLLVWDIFFFVSGKRYFYIQQPIERGFRADYHLVSYPQKAPSVTSVCMLIHDLLTQHSQLKPGEKNVSAEAK